MWNTVGYVWMSLFFALGDVIDKGTEKMKRNSSWHSCKIEQNSIILKLIYILDKRQYSRHDISL